MQGHYIYGIVSFPPELSGEILGLGGNPVRLLPRGDVAAVVSRSTLTSWPLDDAHLTLHEAVVEEVMKSRPILPVRFNTLLRTEEAVIALLDERARDFRSALERVRGRVEMGLRVLWEPPGESEAPADQEIEGRGPGTEYLSRRLKDEWRRAKLLQAGERLIQELDAPLRSLAIESRLQRFPTKRFLVAGAYLVERHRVDAFREGVMTARERFPRLRFLLTGPWPPYNFVNGAQDGTVHAFAA
ncbi:MAG: GvpL/GvpF family gas vesicle protein [candidate division NC10 bacterium]